MSETASASILATLASCGVRLCAPVVVGALYAVSSAGCGAARPIGSSAASAAPASGRNTAIGGAPGHASDTDAAAPSDGARPLLSGPVLLASGQPAPAAIAVDRSNVYWFNLGANDTTDTKSPRPSKNGQIMKCAIGGCGNDPTPLATGRSVARIRDRRPECILERCTHLRDRRLVVVCVPLLEHGLRRCT
jgi:hypothetical protein